MKAARIHRFGPPGVVVDVIWAGGTHSPDFQAPGGLADLPAHRVEAVPDKKGNGGPAPFPSHFFFALSAGRRSFRSASSENGF